MAKAISKIIRWVVLVIIIVIVAAVLIFNFAGNSIVKKAIEYGGTNALDVGVTVGDVDLSITKARFEITDLIVDNPAGYTTDNMLKLGNLVVDSSYGELLADPAVIEEIIIDNVQITLEQKGMGNNIKDVLNNVSKKASAEEKPAGESKKLKIKRLEIKGASVQAKLIGGPVTFKLDPIIMTDLGSDEPLDVATLSAKILTALVSGIIKQGGGLLPADITDAMGASLDKAKEILGKSGKILEGGQEAGKKILESGKDVGEGVKDAGESVKKGLEGLFKPKE